MTEIISKSTKYKILLFGKLVAYDLQEINVDYCDITICSYPSDGEFEKLDRLSEYDIIIIGYSAFQESQQHYLQIFDKQLTQALDLGKTLCILHYSELIPDYDSDSQIKYFLDWQIGFRKVIPVGTPRKNKYSINTLEIKRQEFKTFGENWGMSDIVFELASDPVEYDEIFSISGVLSGFSYQEGKGRVLFLPCQRHYTNKTDLKNCLTSLINSILNYIKNIERSLPSWAETPLFEGETEIFEELQQTKTKISELEKSLEPFQAAKNLSFLREYNFENAVPEFIENHIGLPVLRNDISKEDFWILDSDGNKQIIGETKTYLRGFKKTGIYNLYTHRETNNLEDDFPALLIINQHTIANSWKEKIQPIPPQDYELAVTNNVLIMRVEDLLFFWNLIVKGEKTKEDLHSYLSECGWLEVAQAGFITLHKTQRKSR